jgi:hypothetical protein
MILQPRHLGAQPLLIPALMATLLAGITVVQWAMGQRKVLHVIVTSCQPQYMAHVGGDLGGGH